MFDLLFNGLSAAGSAAGVASYISGFTLERNVAQIRQSLERLEKLHRSLASRTSFPDSQFFNELLGDFSGLRALGQQRGAEQLLQDYDRQLREQFRLQASSVVEDLVGEMKALSQAVRVVETEPVEVDPRLMHGIHRDAWGTGIRDIIEVPQGRLYGATGRRLVDRESTPLVWTDPRSRKRFLGTMPLGQLRRYGVHMGAPTYHVAADGFVYSPSHGLYLPTFYLG